MDDVLYRYLEEQWKLNNIPRYYRYFDEWVNSLTENQIYYYKLLWLK